MKHLNGLERHLRCKFAFEVFMGIQGFLPDVEFLPDDKTVHNWEVLYPLKRAFLDSVYKRHIHGKAKEWKNLEKEPFHVLWIPETKQKVNL